LLFPFDLRLLLSRRLIEDSRASGVGGVDWCRVKLLFVRFVNFETRFLATL
jgi:hypothetical protein